MSRQESERRLDDAAVIAKLAALSPLDYDRAREAEAEALGIRVGTLDDMVKERRDAGDTNCQGSAITFEVLEPWGESVDAAALLDEIEILARRHLILPAHGAVALTLWVMLTWLADVVRILPILAITSVLKGCGKTTVLELLRHLCHRAQSASNISAPALFRFVEKYAPTLLIDEADSFFRDNDELRGIVNSGHTRTSAFVIRLTGDDYEPSKFSTWCPKAIAAIGRLPETITDRSIRLAMCRKGPGESIEPMPDDDAGFVTLRRKLARFAADRGDMIAKSKPELPQGVENRKADNWRVLIAIADAAGGRWPILAREACQGAVVADGEDDSLRESLLADVRFIFAVKATDKMGSAAIIEALTAMTERPWSECNKGNPISTRQLAKWLREFGVRSRDIRPTGQPNCKGYELGDFADPFRRYLPCENPRQRDNGSTTRVPSDFNPRHQLAFVTDGNGPKPNGGAGCHAVTDKNTAGGRDIEERAAILEYEAGFSLAEAERRAREA